MSYIHGSKLTVTVGAKTYSVQTSNVSESAEETDVTNTKGGGFDEHIYGFKNLTMDCTVVVPIADVPAFRAGTFSTATWAVTGGRSYTGTLGVSNVRETAGVRGANTLQFTGKFTGSYTVA